jgi:hypothetical protein
LVAPRLGDDQLPIVDLPTVTLPLAQLKRFRESFRWLLEFAADVCGTTPEQLCIRDVDRYRYQHGLPVRDPLMRHLAAEADRRRQDRPPEPDHDAARLV